VTERVGVLGITGYTGYELVRLIAGHEGLELTYGGAGASAGTPLVEAWPGLSGLSDLVVEAADVDAMVERCDVIFLGLPHGHAAAMAPELVERGVRVVDLGADFRLEDPAIYARYYGLEHPNPQWLDRAVYGLPEMSRAGLPDARLIATPGCYVTAVTLAALPLVRAGLLGGPLVASGLSGISGAGGKPGPKNLFCTVGESVQPYGLAGAHRHTAEMEQNLGVPVSFTPHLVPMNRGLLATVSAPLAADISAVELQEIYQAAYGDEPLLAMREDPPSTGDVRGSCRAHIHVAVDRARSMVTAVCAIDNLLKGAAGQAVQALNASLGLPETTGLPLYPTPL
jgi:N-acetyl-gamma-glutamyl-phosphate reductase